MLLFIISDDIMTYQQLIQQTKKLTKHDFLEYMHTLQHLAPQRYSYNIFLKKMTHKDNKEIAFTKNQQQSFSRSL